MARSLANTNRLSDLTIHFTAPNPCPCSEGLISSNRQTSSVSNSLSSVKAPHPSPRFKPPRSLQENRITHSPPLLLLESLTFIWLQFGLRYLLANSPGCSAAQSA
ncbi:unnamed protein product [Linum tenue]|uniref:Uncharacterized protein n=1 Tax=Linum tenue TaxID=586396 RepID=A0AAV0GZV5_9ROSI|nr:unnamed protein product [Linum tenue]